MGAAVVGITFLLDNKHPPGVILLTVNTPDNLLHINIVVAHRVISVKPDLISLFSVRKNVVLLLGGC